MSSVIERIVEQNLGVYRAAPSRLQEDVSQEAQVASDYRGRLVYELLQNADDAMAGSATDDDRVLFLVTEDELWIANTGRSLTDEDVHGLCGLGASSKVDPAGNRRASIGHKGLGFKSVLEVTDEPIVYSRTHSFKLGARHARPAIENLWREDERAPPRSVPAMRFPARLEQPDGRWSGFSANGFNTAFRFPFRDSLDVDRRAAVADLLLELPLTTVLFLKHLEVVEVRVERAGESTTRTWRVKRERLDGDEWSTTTGLSGSGIYRVSVAGDVHEAATFLVAHDEDVQIGAHRVGLSGPAWDGVELTEVSVATLAPGSGDLPAAWRRFHVFLPTSESCPYPILVNGAFSTDLSRQRVRVSAEAGDYNTHLVRQGAALVRAKLVPLLRASGAEAVLAALDRGVRHDVETDTAAGLLHAAITRELAAIPLLPCETGPDSPLAEAILPPAVLDDDGAAFRAALGEDPVWEGRRFPSARFCAGRWANVAADHGAMELSPATSLRVLAALVSPARAASLDDDSGGFELDPVLELCTVLWRRASGPDRAALEECARQEPLFPVRRNDDRSLVRTAIGNDTAFYPPQSARQDLPLRGLRFMYHGICWGALNRSERLTMLGEPMKAWSSLFDVRDFSFQEVMSAAVIPALGLHPDAAARELGVSLRDMRTLAAICELAGRFAKPDRPLRYQRLQSDRALFPLSRLPVLCRSRAGTEEWQPAYRVYFGADWIGEDSVERITDATADPAALDVAYLAAPDRFLGLLDALGPAPTVSRADELGDEIGDDEDADQALETDEHDRWIAFLAWIGVNRALRPVHFHDVDDDGTGWLTTKGLAQPRGWAFSSLGETWQEFRRAVDRVVSSRSDTETVVPYLYEAHDLDLALPVSDAAERDASGAVSRALFAHLVRHWSWYSQFADTQLALTGAKAPGQRSFPPKAKDDELVVAGDNLWLQRLQNRAICPTSHGPRRPDVTWLPSAELERRFGGRRRSSAQLLPVLDVPTGLPNNAVRSLAERLGVRAEPSPSTFQLTDAVLLCERLQRLYGDAGTPIDTTVLRDVIKPVYRELFALLSGQSTAGATDPALHDAPLLADTADGLRFLPARDVLYARTPGVRERSGVAGTVATFVLEAEPAATAPLTRLFGVRTLEDALEWHPDPGECSLDADELVEARAGLRSLVPPLLARIRVERNDPRDARLLSAFFEQVEPVDALDVSCTLDGVRLQRVAERPYFVRTEPLQAFIVWNEPRAWPPPPEAAQGLAMALADALGINLVETFLAFIQSDGAQQRRLLEIAGAAGLLGEIVDELADPQLDHEPGGDDEGPAPTAAPGGGDSGETAARPPTGPAVPAAPPMPLLRFEDLTIGGEPMLVRGEAGSANGGQSGDARARPPQHPDGAGRAARGTDLGALDALGMRVAIAYEVHRLRGAGHDAARELVPGEPEPGDTFVIDVHNPDVIRAAEATSPVARRVLLALEQQGVSRLYPGFDLLTVTVGDPDRLIELKSSGVDARVQTMSWNEWKTARASHLRDRFWLYLAGNLRADLAHAEPFVRAINNPFGTLGADEVHQGTVRRAVQLRVREFTIAEQLDLGVRAARAATPP